MGTKNNPGLFDCYANADNDEPMFVLLGRDKQAPKLVRDWAYTRLELVKSGSKPFGHIEKAIEALKCADAMEEWQAEEFMRKAAKLAAEALIESFQTKGIAKTLEKTDIDPRYVEPAIGYEVKQRDVTAKLQPPVIDLYAKTGANVAVLGVAYPVYSGMSKADKDEMRKNIGIDNVPAV